MKQLIKKLIDWWNEEETLGHPDPSAHDRNNENSAATDDIEVES